MGNIELLEDACAKLPHTTRAMFGGHGLFAPNGGMFAGIVDDDRIILKFAAHTPEHVAFLATGTQAWVYAGKQGAMTMKEWLLVPDEMYDEPEVLSSWAAKAHKLAPAKKGKSAKKSAAPPAKKGKKPASRKAPTSAKTPAKKAASKKKR